MTMEVRENRWLGWLSGLTLDVKLGGRMLGKYPWLTIVGGLGLAVAIGAGTVLGTFLSIVNSTAPLPEGDRLVAIENWDLENNNQERQILHDFLAWRDGLHSVQDVGAYTDARRTIRAPDLSPSTALFAEMSAAGFRVASIPPLLGRTLLEEDERPGAPNVLVLGYDIWERAFGTDSTIIGREVSVGAEIHTVVGVMPDGFGFPMYHEAWTPLRVRPSIFEPRTGPDLRVFGRLVPGATLDQAQAELTAIGQRTAAETPETHEMLRPEIIPFTMQPWDDFGSTSFVGFHVLILLLLLVVCVNVAVLVYARTAIRESEIAIRGALGAGRRRIVGQLFIEALVLCGVAAVVGIGIAELVLRQVESIFVPMGALVPFWMRLHVSSSAIAYTLGLALIGAFVIGAIPALKATGDRMQEGLKRISLGGSGLRFGRTWATMIVLQVAITVAALPAALLFGPAFVRYGLVEPDPAAERYLTARVILETYGEAEEQTEGSAQEFEERYGDRFGELLRRIEAEPEVADVTYAANLPTEGERMDIVIDPLAPGESGLRGSAVMVRGDIGFFDAFDIPILVGRGFANADLGENASPVIVSRSFVDEFLGGANAVGQSVRWVSGYRSGGVMRVPEPIELDRPYQIVGVVEDYPAQAMELGATQARVYHPVSPAQVEPTYLIAHTRNARSDVLAGRLREITADLDPALQLVSIRTMADVLTETRFGMRVGAISVVVGTLSVLLLSAAGLYAMMSLAVTQRRREIGIRTALGGARWQVLRSVFSRVLTQLAAGIVAGVALAVWLDFAPRVLLLVVVVMTTVGLLAALGPARRSLRIQPMDALREE